MIDDTKAYIQMHLSILKEAMKKENLIFGILVDKEDVENSKLCFIDKNSIGNGKYDGFSISLTDLNNDLI